MSPLKVQSITALVLSVPFAAKGFLTLDGAVWAMAFGALLVGLILFGLDNAIDRGIIQE